MKYFDAFSGIGGFSKGIIQAHEFNRNPNVQKERGRAKTPKGVYEKRKRLHPVPSETTVSIKDWDNEHTNGSTDEGQPNCVGSSEIDKYAIQIYKKHFPTHKNYGDITAIDTATLPDFDCFVGGFPCQAFSIAGKRRGFEDTRGTLFFECARIIRDKRPRTFVLENVKGLLSHEKGETFKTIIRTLTELGYCVEWQVLNSKNFGVPQNRERVFIVGHLRGSSGRKIFPIFGGSKKAYGTSLNQINNNAADAQRIYDSNGDPSFTLTSQDRHGVLIHSLYPRSSKTNKGGTGHLTKQDNTAYCLDTGNMQAVEKDFRIRRLTPTECERLQGFPDGWTEGLSDTQRYKCLGNAVTVNVIEAIFKKLIK